MTDARASAPVQRPPWRRSETWARAVSVLLLAGFVVAFAARQAIVLSHADIDDALFITLGQHLATGRWLGPYNELTLAKGPGFPAFLAMANVAGLPFPLALALAYAAAAAFAAAVMRRLSGSPWLGVAMLAVLLLAPPLYDGEMLRVFRDVFYSALVIALASALIALSSGALGKPRSMAVVTGLLAAWAWLTREEGVWLLPLALVLVIPALASGPLRARLTRLRPAGIAIGVAVAAVVGVGLINAAVYGRFVVNEIKDGAFQDVLSALQDASAPFHKTGVPVPGAARARIYAQSPAFAELQEPILDGRYQADATQWGCLQNRAMCGDFGGGWFQWSLRTSAADKGHHRDAREAARFYRELAAQVRAACHDGRLTCRRWMLPLVPPMTAGEIPLVGASLVRVADIVTYGATPGLNAPQPDLTALMANRMVSFLSLPGDQAPGRIRMVGWYRAEGPAWFRLEGGPGVQVLEVRRLESPDLVAAFNDPSLTRQRLIIEVQCPSETACPAQLTPDGGTATPIDLARMARGDNAVGAANLFLDDPGADKAKPFLKTRFSQAWIAGAARLTPVYRLLVIVGGLAFAVSLALGARRRALPPATLVCAAILAAVAARALILALMDALAFRATTHPYALPATLLMAMFSLYAIQAARESSPARP